MVYRKKTRRKKGGSDSKSNSTLKPLGNIIRNMSDTIGNFIIGHGDSIASHMGSTSSDSKTSSAKDVSQITKNATDAPTVASKDVSKVIDSKKGGRRRRTRKKRYAGNSSPQETQWMQRSSVQREIQRRLEMAEANSLGLTVNQLRNRRRRENERYENRNQQMRNSRRKQMISNLPKSKNMIAIKNPDGKMQVGSLTEIRVVPTTVRATREPFYKRIISTINTLRNNRRRRRNRRSIRVRPMGRGNKKNRRAKYSRKRKHSKKKKSKRK